MATRPTLLHRLRAWLAQVIAVEPGKPNDGLVELSAGTERDKPWSELSREFSDALEAWRFNPLARRIVGLVTAYVVGDGLVLRSPRPRVHAFLQAFQRDPENNLLLEQAEWCDELTRSGEIFLVLFARIDGTVVVRAAGQPHREGGLGVRRLPRRDFVPRGARPRQRRGPRLAQPARRARRRSARGRQTPAHHAALRG